MDNQMGFSIAQDLLIGSISSERCGNSLEFFRENPFQEILCDPHFCVLRERIPDRHQINETDNQVYPSFLSQRDWEKFAR